MIDGLEDALEDSGQPGLAELRGVLSMLLHASRLRGRLTCEQALKRRWVYRLAFEIDGGPHTVVVKCLTLARAQRNQLVATRWLPAVGLGQRCPALLGVAADRSARCIWHVYEDLGDGVLDPSNVQRGLVEAAVEVIARLHVCFAEHALLPECRLYGHDRGMAFYDANIRDAIRGLKGLTAPSFDLDPERTALLDRLLARLHELHDEGPDRAGVLAEVGGYETLLHGDLRPTNILAVPAHEGLDTRLIDWNAAGVGPLTYDLSTFLYAFQAEQRPWILKHYEQAIAPLGWRVPSRGDLNLLLETAEISRLANSLVWTCVAAVQTHSDWPFDRLGEIETWFEALESAV